MNTKKTQRKRNALGRGLGALLDDTSSVQRNEEIAPKAKSVGSISEILISEVEVNPFQPRDYFDQEALQELAESIKVQGIIQPITVRRLDEKSYQLISGERRLQASKLAGLKAIPAYIRTADDQQMLELALIENIQRENLNAIEIALSYQRLLSECNLKQEALGDRVGKNRSTVNNYLRLLKLPPDIQAALRDKKISMGHARTLINVESVEKQLVIFYRIIKEDLSVRRAESLVRELSIPKIASENNQKPVLGYELKQIQDKLSSHFGTKVDMISKNNDKGEIKIPYVSIEDLNRILEILDV